MNIQLTNEQFQQFLMSATNNQQAHSSSYQKDYERTGIHMYDSTKQNIYEYMNLYEIIVTPKYTDGRTQTKALLSRIPITEQSKLGEGILDMTYKDLVLRIYDKLGSHLTERDFNITGLHISLGENYTDFLSRMRNRWSAYNTWLFIEKKAQKTELEFIEAFIEAMPQAAKQILATKRAEGTIKSIKDLEDTVITYRYLWKVINETPTDKINIQKLEEQIKNNHTALQQSLQANINTLELNLNSTLDAKLGAYKQNTDYMKQELTQTLQQLNEIKTQNNKQITELAKATEKATELIIETNDRINDEQKYRQEQHQRTLARQQTLITQLNTLQEDIRQYRHNDNDQHHQLNNMHIDRQNHIRQREHPSPYQNQDYRNHRHKNFSRESNYRSSGSDRSDTSRSRSPSPMSHGNCHYCSGDHWLIDCPNMTRLERENELFKLLAKKKKVCEERQQSFSPDVEEKLREKHNIPNKNNNPSRNHNHSIPPVGEGRYCKWEHIKGHDTLLCHNFCPICEKQGHSWTTCNSDPNFVNKRLTNLRMVMAKLATPLRSFRRDPSAFRTSNFRSSSSSHRSSRT